MSVAPVDMSLRSSLLLSRLMSSLELLPALGLGDEGQMCARRRVRAVVFFKAVRTCRCSLCMKALPQ